MKDVLGVVAFTIVVTILAVGCAKEPSGDVSRGCLRERSLRLYEKHFSSHIPQEHPQKDILGKMTGEIRAAVDQGQVDIEHLRGGLAVLTNQFGLFSAGQWDFTPLERVLGHIFESSAFPTNGIHGFSAPQELDRFLLSNLEVATFLGYLRLHSRGYGYEASSVEALVYRSLKTYEASYAEMRERDFLAVVSNHLTRWTRAMESENGVSRLAARRVLAYELERIKDIGDISYEDAVKAARSHAQGFINCGYTPQWLDEEFPLPPENGTAKDGDK